MTGRAGRLHFHTHPPVKVNSGREKGVQARKGMAPLLNVTDVCHGVVVATEVSASGRVSGRLTVTAPLPRRRPPNRPGPPPLPPTPSYNWPSPPPCSPPQLPWDKPPKKAPSSVFAPAGSRGIATPVTQAGVAAGNPPPDGVGEVLTLLY